MLALTKPPTYPLHPVKPNNTHTTGFTATAGTSFGQY